MGGLAASVAAAPVGLLFHATNIPQWEFDTDQLSLMGALFGLTYRYAVRTDANPMLRQGVVARPRGELTEAGMTEGNRGAAAAEIAEAVCSDVAAGKREFAATPRRGIAEGVRGDAEAGNSRGSSRRRRGGG